MIKTKACQWHAFFMPMDGRQVFAPAKPAFPPSLAVVCRGAATYKDVRRYEIMDDRRYDSKEGTGTTTWKWEVELRREQ